MNLRELTDATTCPTCGSPPHKKCISPLGLPRRSPHNERYRAAQLAINPDEAVIMPNRRPGGFPLPLTYDQNRRQDARRRRKRAQSSS